MAIKGGIYTAESFRKEVVDLYGSGAKKPDRKQKFKVQVGVNPRALGVNPRALGVNPRALGVNPRNIVLVTPDDDNC